MKSCLVNAKSIITFTSKRLTDLPSIIQKPEILKSLHSINRKSAHVAASCPLPGILQLLPLAQTGFISQEQAAGHQIVIGLHVRPTISVKS